MLSLPTRSGARPLPRTLCVAAALAAVAALPAAPAPADAQVIAQGRFGPTAQYTGTGTATVRRSGSVRTISTSRNFTARGAIRLRLYLATSPTARKRIDLGPMAKRGAQTLRIPSGVNLKRYRYAIAWCVTVNAPVTQAVLR
jgi:hypothetical protein